MYIIVTICFDYNNTVYNVVVYLGVAMGSEEERVLENQLEFQLQEQRDSLSAIDQALLSDPTNLELLAVPLSLSLYISLSCFNQQKFNFFNSS